MRSTGHGVKRIYRVRLGVVRYRMTFEIGVCSGGEVIEGIRITARGRAPSDERAVGISRSRIVDQNFIRVGGRQYCASDGACLAGFLALAWLATKILAGGAFQSKW